MFNNKKYIYCAICGLKNCILCESWGNESMRVTVCGKECFDKLEMMYARYILGRPEPDE